MSIRFTADKAIEELVSTLSIQNVYWTAWERAFIGKLEGKKWNWLSPKQREKVKQLWEKV